MSSGSGHPSAADLWRIYCSGETRMKSTYGVLAAALLSLSTLLGLFFIGSAGLAASERTMAYAWLFWLLAVATSIGSAYVSLQRNSLPAVLGSSALPLAAALLGAKLALALGQ